MATYFVSIELTDPEINALFWQIRDSVDLGQKHAPIHITIRGPYDEPIGADSINLWQELLDQYPLVIADVGSFRNRDETVVYFKIQHPNLRQIWWKPDFPIEKFGFNPHITIYKGKDIFLAQKIVGFFAKENISLLCRSFKLVTQVSKQNDLFMPDEPEGKAFINLIDKGKVRLTMLMDLDHMVRRHKRELLNSDQIGLFKSSNPP